MQYSIKPVGGGTEITLQGRLTFAEATLFPKILAELEKAGRAQWDILLGGLQFIDSTGMSLFVHIYDTATATGTKVTVHGASGAVRDALDRAAFQTLFEFR